MLINERDARLIQRCVDQELSTNETRALLQRLDALSSGWKTLACGLLEDRSLQRSIRSPGFQNNSPQNPDAARRDTGPMVHVPPRARADMRQWWSHPITSLTLCAAIAFVGGMLIPDLRSGSTLNVASNARSVVSGNSSRQVAPTSEHGTYRLQMGPGEQAIEIPVYSELQDLYQRDRNHPLFSNVADKHGQQIQWMLVPVEGNKSMLIPVSEDTEMDMQ